MLWPRVQMSLHVSVVWAQHSSPCPSISLVIWHIHDLNLLTGLMNMGISIMTLFLEVQIPSWLGLHLQF